MIWKPSKAACLRSPSGMCDFPPGRLGPQSDHVVFQIGLLMEGLGRVGSRSRGIGAVFKKVVKCQQAGFFRPQKRGVGTLRPPWTLLCSQIPRVDSRRRIRMRDPEGQIENSGYGVREHAGDMLLLGPLANGQLPGTRRPNRPAVFGFSSTHSTKWSNNCGARLSPY